MSITPQNIPVPLRQRHQWLLWRIEERGGKPTKVPYSATGFRAKSNDPHTWCAFPTAIDIYESGKYSGIGFAMAEDDGLVGLDFDKCVTFDADGNPILSPDIDAIIERFQDCSYIEMSPSGRGLRMFTYGKPQRCGKGAGDFKWIEVYDWTSPRYLTVTGNAILPDRLGNGQPALDWLHDTYMQKPEAERPRPGPVVPSAPIDMSDQEILERARNSTAGTQFSALYDRGDIASHSNDWSSADLALCNMLAFWFGRDPRRMDAAFQHSALMRPKWNVKHHSDGRTYGEATIDRAISACRETYDPNYRSSSLSPGPEPRTARTAPPSPPPPDDLGDDYDGDGGDGEGHDDDNEAIVDRENRRTDWARDLLIYSKPDREGFSFVKSLPVNALRILTHDTRWCGVLGFDEFRSCPVFLMQPKFSAEYAIKFERGQPVEELDIDRITYWLSERWGVNINPDRCARIVETVAQQRSFHPVREYLDGVTWDGTHRIGDWLRTYMDARYTSTDQLEYIQLIGKWWLMSAVARIMVPGAKADYVLVLEGHEGIRKSSALRCLAGKWFTDAALDLNNKDAYLQINGSWIVEIAELDALMRSESSTAKAFFTRATDKFRPPYGRKTIELARQCVCAGTVNHNDYIKDYTGGRRYWPVWCNQADLEALAQDRDQIWAEAVHCYREGERYWPEGKRQRDLCRVEQEARQLDDPWESDVVYWLTGRGSATSADLLSSAIGMDKDKWNRGHQTRIGQIMTRLGWERKRDRDEHGNFLTRYVRPAEQSHD